ncbi:MAG: class I SAM-dependent methyltransferase [Ruminococcus sp.]|jgi:SAM-dependent methyltransferase|nr:class I SAM-dependent methyltransferase [uncultured Schaedlerella sp.]MCI9152217.1 class I SAM-dependent methyltransferase [Ruminococcus sp.]
MEKYYSMKENCKMCGKEMALDYCREGYELYKCVKCSFRQIRMDKMSLGVIHGAEYYGNSKYKDSVALDKENSRRAKLLKRYVRGGSRIVDYGCGSGEFVNYIGHDYDIYGCDVSPGAVEVAKRRFPHHKERFFLPDEFFDKNEKSDAFCLWDVIEHIENPDQLIRRLRKMLVENGIIILSTPDIEALFAKLTKSHWPFMTPPDHLCFFSKRSIQYFARKNGFKVCEWFARGKWVNIGFLVYKFNKVSSIKIPQKIVNIFQKGWLATLHIYVPTHDIQYVVLRKR